MQMKKPIVTIRVRRTDKTCKNYSTSFCGLWRPISPKVPQSATSQSHLGLFSLWISRLCSVFNCRINRLRVTCVSAQIWNQWIITNMQIILMMYFCLEF